jgi:VanZ family protein
MQSAYPALKKNTYKIVFVFSFVWGGLIELSQKYFFTYRFAEWEDQIANILGVLMAFAFFKNIVEKLIFKYGKQEN